ncbi:MAG: glycosyltransferase [bacterium]
MREDKSVSLVIPGKNSEKTIRQCLESVAGLLKTREVREILYVDDGSSDGTMRIAQEFPVRCVQGGGRGPGAARNVGWQAAVSPLIWFVDSDCVARPDALRILCEHLADAAVAGAGGSYDNMCPESLLASIIHEEIIARHAAMPTEVNHLGSFNVLYRRSVLKQLGGFDEKFFSGPNSPGAEDAELSYRLVDAGYALHFDQRSRVGHFHPTEFKRYLRAQLHHGYWRTNLYLRYPRRGGGDSYTSLADNIQPPLAMALIPAFVAGLFRPGARDLAFVLTLVLAILQLPMTIKVIEQTGDKKYGYYALIGFIRAFARGIGMSQAALEFALRKIRPIGKEPANPAR